MTACVVFDDSLTAYDFGPAHPMNPARIDLTMRLATELGVVGDGGLPQVPVPDPDDAWVRLVHDQAYVDCVRRAGDDPDDADPRAGLGSDDNPTFPGMHHASSRVVAATVEGARRVWSGEVARAASPSGGLHHAMPHTASGFCVYNDVAVAIAWLLEQGAERVAYVDVDVHHGDGVQAIFWDDPRVLTISLHESPQTLFPGTGRPDETGGPAARGSAVNVALPPGTEDAGWLRAFHAVVPPALEVFGPDVLVTQHGCDSHREDPLAHLMLTVDGQRASYLALADLAERTAGGRWLATGGGGYAITDVVPRAWTHLLAIVAGDPLDPGTQTPPRWREHVRAQTGRPAPATMTDGGSVAFRDWSHGYDPDSWLDRSVQATRTAAFPLLGLDPQY